MSAAVRTAVPASTTSDLAAAHRAHFVRRLPGLVLFNTSVTTLWLVTLGSAGDVGVGAALATAALQLAVLVAAMGACRRRPTAPWVVPLGVAAFAIVGLSWVALFAVSGASGAVLGYLVFVLYVGVGVGAAWGIGPQAAFQGIVIAGWLLALPLIHKRLSGTERLLVAGLGMVIALAISAWAARAFRAELRRRHDEARLTDALAASRDAYRALAENARDFIWTADLKGRIRYVNAALARLHAEPPAALVGRTVADLLTDHPANPPRPDWSPAIMRLRAGETLPPMIVQARSATGPRWVETVISPVREGGVVTGIQATSRDVTERRAAEEALRVSEEKLRLLARRQVAVREEERKRLGFDLHDDVCQELVGIGILVESVRQRLGPIPSDATTDLQRIVRYVNEVVEHVRLLAGELRPMLLHDLGLEGSLRSLVAGLASGGVAVQGSFPTRVPRLEEEAEVAVYRIAQEALGNAIRHARARAIVLTLSASAETLALEVCDDGCGFEAGRPRGRALGLLSMEERAVALGGRLAVQSAPGRGTVVRFECPLAERSPASAA